MKVDHVTYQVPSDLLFAPEMTEFFQDLDLYEVEPDAKIEKDWSVRWFGVYGNGTTGTLIHLVAADALAVDLELGHFCLEVGVRRYNRLKTSRWRDPIGSGESRIWLKGPARLRVEVRP